MEICASQTAREYNNNNSQQTANRITSSRYYKTKNLHKKWKLRGEIFTSEVMRFVCSFTLRSTSFFLSLTNTNAAAVLELLVSRASLRICFFGMLIASLGKFAIYSEYKEYLGGNSFFVALKLMVCVLGDIASFALNFVIVTLSEIDEDFVGWCFWIVCVCVSSVFFFLVDGFIYISFSRLWTFFRRLVFQCGGIFFRTLCTLPFLSHRANEAKIFVLSANKSFLASRVKREGMW